MSALQAALNAIGRGFADGTLVFTLADGRRWVLGDGKPEAEVRLRDTAALHRILRRPGLCFGETYMDGGWEPGDGGLLRVFEVGVMFEEHVEKNMRGRRWRIALARLGEINHPLRARRNVEHHYNLDNALYQRFLGDTLLYSCAYFRTPDLSLDAAQRA